MELKQIKDLMSAMKTGGIKRLQIKDSSGFELQLERHDEVRTASPVVHYAPVKEEEHPVRQPVHHAPLKAEADVAPVLAGQYVTSPMVGTFYVSSSPEDPPFIKVGDRVTENTVVCIIEAMKVMNEVKAGVAGTVAEICVNNASTVEFGTKLLRVTV